MPGNSRCGPRDLVSSSRHYAIAQQKAGNYYHYALNYSRDIASATPGRHRHRRGLRSGPGRRNQLSTGGKGGERE
jgi:hypothetical protein